MSHSHDDHSHDVASSVLSAVASATSSLAASLAQSTAQADETNTHNHGNSGGHDHGDRMDASQMNMAFFTSTSSPLYSNSWTPGSAGAYAGTCIFLILLAILFRSLLAFKHVLERRWLDQALRRRYVTVADRQPEAEMVKSDVTSETAILSSNGVMENVKVVRSQSRPVQPWRFSVDLPRALLQTVIVTNGYLLMLAVMTMNVGYFLSVLAGTFVGELAVGRFTQATDDH